MPEHSETTRIWSTKGSTLIFMQAVSTANGHRILAAYADDRPADSVTWTETTITSPDTPEAWLARATKDATR